jgi:Tfp pilus assembly protein PilN
MIGIRTVTEDGEVLDSFEPPKHKLLFVLFGLLLYLALVLFVTMAAATIWKIEQQNEEAKELHAEGIALEQRIESLDRLIEGIEEK